MPTERIALAILARAPAPGRGKSRLAPLLGAEGTARLQAWLLQRTVATALAARAGPVTLWGTPDARHPGFARFAASRRLTLRDQPEGDLGTRMAVACADAPVLLLGTDCPALTPRHLAAAAAALSAGSDAALLPAEDGGYVMLGLSRPEPRLFEGIDWGTGRVMAQTAERLGVLGWRWWEGPTLWDVDRPADFARAAAAFPGLRRACGLR